MAAGILPRLHSLRIAIKGSAVVGTNNAPVFRPATATRGLRGGGEQRGGDRRGAVIPAATDAESDTLTYSMEGTDAASFAFDISTRQITTVATDFNYEATKNSYTVTVTASDGTDSGTITVTIDVTDVAEQPAKPDPPTVTATAGVAGSLDVSWVKPDLNGGPDITGYELSDKVSSDNIWNGTATGGIGTTATLPGSWKRTRRIRCGCGRRTGRRTATGRNPPPP